MLKTTFVTLYIVSVFVMSCSLPSNTNLHDETIKNTSGISPTPFEIQSTPTLNIHNELAQIAESQLGSFFLGQLVSIQDIDNDNIQEVIFENVIITSNPNNKIGFSLKPLTKLLEITPSPLESPRENMVFRSIKEGKGHNIPHYFHTFIHHHLGYDISGEPITHLLDMGNGTKQQCFTNYCLRYDPQASPNEQVALLPLGKGYHESRDQELTEKTLPGQTSKLELGVWVNQKRIPSSKPQAFGVCAHLGNDPLQDYSASLSISSQKISHRFPPPDKGGCTYLSIAPIQESNGTEITYQVCIKTSWGERCCEEDKFLIWDNP